MYADVQEVQVGRAMKLQESLRRAAAIATKAASSFSTLDTLYPSHSQSASKRQGSLNNQAVYIAPSSSSSSDLHAANAPGNTTATQETPSIERRYLLVCINTSNRVHLENVDVTYTADDQVLFQSIRKVYRDTCKSYTKGYYFSVPKPFSLIFGELTLTIPKAANFVQARRLFLFRFERNFAEMHADFFKV
jgi:hypothetical protein